MTENQAALGREELAAALARLRDDGPLHYFDCERFNVTNYGTRQGTCDCTATSDVDVALADIERLRAALFACAAAAGEDVSDGPPTWPDLADFALAAVRQMREDYEADASDGGSSAQ